MKCMSGCRSPGRREKASWILLTNQPWNDDGKRYGKIGTWERKIKTKVLETKDRIICVVEASVNGR